MDPRIESFVSIVLKNDNFHELTDGTAQCLLDLIKQNNNHLLFLHSLDEIEAAVSDKISKWVYISMLELIFPDVLYEHVKTVVGENIAEDEYFHCFLEGGINWCHSVISFCDDIINFANNKIDSNKNDSVAQAVKDTFLEKKTIASQLLERMIADRGEQPPLSQHL
jgi:hypothetical protein